MDKISYALGLGIGQNLLGMGAKDINIEDFAKGIKDVLSGSELEMDHKTAQVIVTNYIEDLDRKMTQERIKASKEFLEENKKKADVITLPSGLQYTILSEGKKDGKKATANDRVECHYEGRLLDGRIFDSSYQRKQPATFGVNQVISGWVEALQLMPEGAKWRLFIPSELAYGEHGAGEAIPPHSALVFDVELIKVL